MPYTSPQAKRAHDRLYYAARRSILAAKQREYYRRNRKRCAEGNKRRIAQRPWWYRAILYSNAANRRAQRWGAPGKLYGREIKHLVGPCAYCGGVQETWDHVVPLCRGGANDRTNLVSACHRCNRAKSKRTPEEWHAGVRISQFGWRPHDADEIARLLE